MIPKRLFTGPAWAGFGLICLFVAAGCKSNQHPIEEPNSLMLQPDDPRVVDLSRLATTRPAEPIAEPVVIDRPAGPDGPGGATLIYTCHYSRPETLRDAVEGLISPQGSISPSAALNTLVVSDTPENVRAILGVLKSLDRATGQLIVEARVVEVTLTRKLEFEIRQALSVPRGDSFFQSSDLLSLGSDGKTPSSDQGSNIALRTFAPGSVSLDTFIRLLMTRGKTRILSSPNVIVSPGTEANIISGQERPIQSVSSNGNTQSITTIFKRVGVKLRVNLLQLTNDTARMELNPEVSSVGDLVETGQDEKGTKIFNPVISIRSASSTVSMSDGEILTIGGLVTANDRATRRGVPGLQDAPGVGGLFKSNDEDQERTQVIFFIRVRIVPAGKPEDVRVLKPGDGFRLIDQLDSATTRPVVPLDRPEDK